MSILLFVLTLKELLLKREILSFFIKAGITYKKCYRLDFELLVMNEIRKEAP